MQQPRSESRLYSAGFTLVELMMVIAVIAILAALLLEPLSAVKRSSQATQCLNNLKQMQTAWTLYADESAQVLVPNVGEFQLQWVSNRCWVVGDVSRLPDETNSALLSTSLLGPYARNVSIYRCPADPGNPAGTPRVRSISMNNYMHGKGMALDPEFVHFTKTTDIRQPSSSFVFLDERPTSINDGYFVMLLTTNFDQMEINDFPANYHNLSGGFAFADGHAMLKKWQTPLFQSTSTHFQFKPNPGNSDYIWMMKNTTVTTNGLW